MELAVERHGVFTRVEAIEVGLSPKQIQHRVRVGIIKRMHLGVYGFVGAKETWEQLLVGAQLWLGEGWVASHRAAGQIWGLDAIPSDVVELTGPGRPPSRPPGIHLHRSGRLNAYERTVRRGLVVTSPPRTLMDLGSVIPPGDVEAAMESALRKGLVSIDYLTRFLDRSSASGRNGCGVLRTVLDRRSKGIAPTESVFETRLDQALRRARVPLPIRQHRVSDGSAFVGRVDFAYPDRMLVIEADSYANHSARLDWENDLARRNKLTLLGWRVMHVTWKRLRDAPSEVAEEISRALGHQSFWEGSATSRGVQPSQNGKQDHVG